MEPESSRRSKYASTPNQNSRDYFLHGGRPDTHKLPNQDVDPELQPLTAWGWRPTNIHRRTMPMMTEPSAYGDVLFTGTLANPPVWALEDGLPCHTGDPDRFELGNNHHHNPSHALIAEARSLCEGCPSMARCLDAAMEEEDGLPASSRWLVRGGLLPIERARLDGC